MIDWVLIAPEENRPDIENGGWDENHVMQVILKGLKAS